MTIQSTLLKQAAVHQPETMEKIAAILFVLEQRDSATAAQVADEMGEIADYTAEKMAAAGYTAGERFGLGLGAAVIAGVASTMSADLYDAAKRGLTKSRNYSAIMKANPEFKHLDKARLSNTFDSIHRYAPEFTADPIMGGSLLKSVYDAGPGMDHVMVRELINNRKNLQDVKHTQFRMGPIPALELERAEDRAKEERDNAFSTRMEKDKQKIRRRERVEDAAAAAREYGLKERQLKAQLGQNEAKQRAELEEKNRRLKVETGLKPMIDVRLHQAKANIDGVKNDRNLTTAQKNHRIGVIADNARQDIARLRKRFL